jgi:hypothetical protein
LTLKMRYSLSQVKHLKLLQIKKLKTKSLKDSKSKRSVDGFYTQSILLT